MTARSHVTNGSAINKFKTAIVMAVGHHPQAASTINNNNINRFYRYSSSFAASNNSKGIVNQLQCKRMQHRTQRHIIAASFSCSSK